MLTQRTFLQIVLLLPSWCMGQFYMKGRVVDDKNLILANVKMRLLSNGMLYANGASGEFGLPSTRRFDTVFCYATGYDSVKVVIKYNDYNTIVLKPTPFTREEKQNHLSSLTPNLGRNLNDVHYLNDESYSNLIENSFVDASKFPTTGFSLNINKASYSNVRRYINNHTIMPTDAVRTEEMLNYFSLCFAPKPEGNNVFGIKTQISGCPWDSSHLLLFIGVRAKKIDIENVPPSNLVFLIDNSGSMDMPNRLPLLKAGFTMLVNNLRDKDTVTIVSYGGTASLLLSPTGGAEKEKIIAAIEGLSPAGETPGSSGLKLAYQMAQSKFVKDGNNRVILATDGDFNVGQINDKELESLIKNYRNSGIYLTCLGVGMGNYKDSKLETLARYGNGNFAYLDNEAEAEKVLVKEFAQTVLPVASNVSLNINFVGSALVNQYRLIGFDNRRDALFDSTTLLEGGEIGSGHSIIAIAEIIPNKKKLDRKNITNNPIGKIELKYQLPEKTPILNDSQEIADNYLPFNQLDSTLRFATSIAMFSTLAKQSKYAVNYNFDSVFGIALTSVAAGNLVQMEYLSLLQKAKELYAPKSVKRKKKSN